MPNTFVVIMGLGTVFFGLICIILLSVLTSKVCQILEKMKGSTAPAAPAPAAAPVSAAPAAPIPNRQAMIAAIAAAIAEDLGTDAAGIRILSVKKI